ncbi:hypothetical protein BDW59DRAFT_157881 [Aspergillus cavernicola]|uniref:Zn(2)-C6 fungal-type domain-containing protein n=1 Tax=Aspergillus cavernicola TaxID=176166 RepID=A0ABR4IV44_9EURO
MASISSDDESRTCSQCLQHFTHKSSLIRHAKRCLRNEKPIPRRKACLQCASSKARCDLRRPFCGRCQARSTPCEFTSTHEPIIPDLDFFSIQHETQLLPPRSQPPDGYDYLAIDNDWLYPTAPSPGLSPPSSGYYTGTLPSLCTTPEIDPQILTEDLDCSQAILFDGILSDQPRQEPLGPPPNPLSPNSDILKSRTVHFIQRVLKSWPRMMAIHGTTQLPPIIHRSQVADGIPAPLVNCYTLAKCWITGMEGGVGVMRDSILQEIRRLLSEYKSYDASDLLAALQSTLILLIILFFGLGPELTTTNPLDAQLLLNVWDMKTHLAATGLFLDLHPTSSLIIPPWQEWALISAKHRTMLALHHLDFVWSVLRGYPMLHCFELGPLPAPAPRYLWQADGQQQMTTSTWQRLYSGWRAQWEEGGEVVMEEFFRIRPGDGLDERVERWLADADEFGMMLMAAGMDGLARSSGDGVG